MIGVKNLSFSYGGHEAIKNISFSAEAGECVGILGNNGAGKSTLISCIANIRKPQRGEVLLEGVPVSKMKRGELAKKTAYLSQQSEAGGLSVFDCVLLGRKPYIKWAASAKDLELCADAICKLGLEKLQLRQVNELSGGELQRVMLARALAQQPKLLLLDEPTGSLDPKNQHETLSLVRTLAAERGITALIVLHDLNLALRYCDRLLLLKNGESFRYCPAAEIGSEDISKLYGVSARITEIDGVRVVITG